MFRVVAVASTLALMAISSPSIAVDDKMEYCAISGFAMGWDDQLIASLALRLSGSGPECKSTSERAHKAGARMSKVKPLQPGDKELYQSYSAFKKKIDEAILRSAGF